MITIRIPAPSSMLVANLLGALGLLVIVTSVGLLAGFAWAGLTGGVFLVFLSLVATSHAARAEAAVLTDEQSRATPNQVRLPA